MKLELNNYSSTLYNCFKLDIHVHDCFYETKNFTLTVIFYSKTRIKVQSRALHKIGHTTVEK